MTAQTRVANRLAAETSPYLRQHAHNPVDWYPWGAEALGRAKAEDKPIFLSIGYSACHWCHVMEHESFEDEATARVMNEHFVNIKVDREERPDLDQIYMNAVVALTGHGGWPMSVFLTPDLRPFYGGTYFPPEDRHGLPSFQRVLLSVADGWRHRRQDLLRGAAQLTEHLRQEAAAAAPAGEPTAELIRHAADVLEAAFDPRHGGFGRAPKFPHALELRLLLRAWKRFSDDQALAAVRLTLDKMAQGGLYDHLGGGFHRYSTDARWLVPHFEKMLYDNALLAITYLEAYQATGEAFYRRVAEETLAWVARDMTSPEGGFYSTLDADSDGEEGKYYVWSAREVDEILGADAELFKDVYDVTAGGNWEGHSILNRSKTDEQDARLHGVDAGELRVRLTEAKRRLLAARERRTPPGRDEKVLTAWNGLMIGAFAQAAQVLGGGYDGIAERSAEFVLTRLRAPDGRLLRTYSSPGPAKLNAYLEDYAFMIDALVSLYEATLKARWLSAAQELAGLMLDQFADPAGGFYFVGKDHEPLIVRGKDPHDGSVPSGNSVAATALLRLARLTGREDLDKAAAGTLRHFAGPMSESPAAFGQMLIAADFYLGPVQEFAVIGDRGSPMTADALSLIRQGFRPNKVVAWGDGSPDTTAVPLVAGKTTPPGEVSVYVCERFACRAPLVGLGALRDWLVQA
jgi:hypothetical protein